MNQPNLSFSARFDQLADGRSDRLAIREQRLDWRYTDVDARSSAVTDALLELGVRSGHAVALMAPNTGAFVSSFLGIARAGGVVAPFNVRYQQQELVYYLRDTRAAAIIVASELVPVVADALATLKDPPSLLAIEADGSCNVVRPRTGDAEAIATWGSADSDSSEATPLLLQYTSGSTGAPKRIIRTNRMLAD